MFRAVFAAAVTAVLIVPVSIRAQVTAEEQESAQAAEPPRRAHVGLEEIVVTAEKREALLNETPIAVTAFDTSTMEDLQINSATDYTTLVPSLSYRQTPNRIFIRGIGRTQNSLGLDPGVAIYTDGVYTSETAALNSAAFGVERIEVLRGPQGTLYGRNATGGAVNFITQGPQDEFSWQARARIGSYATREYGLLATGPITDWLRFHVLATDNSRDAYTDNASGHDVGTANARFYRVQLEADLTEDLTLWIKWNKALWDYIPQGSGLGSTTLTPWQTCCNVSPITFSSQRNITAVTGRVNPATRDAHEADINSVGTVRLQNTYHVSSNLTWQLDTVQVKYIGGFQTYDFNSKHTDFDGTPRTDGFGLSSSDLIVEEAGINDVRLFVREDKQYYSHELQVTSTTDSPLQWIAGLYYYNEEIEQPLTVYKPNQPNLKNICVSCGNALDLGNFNFVRPFLTPVLGPPELRANTSNAGTNVEGVVFHQQGKLKSKAYAAYGEVYWSFAERFKLTAGLRSSKDRKHGEEYQTIVLDALYIDLDYRGVSGLPDCCGFYVHSLDFPERNGVISNKVRDDWRATTGRLVLDFQPDDDTLLYASATQGYKAGGLRLGSFQPSFQDEEVLSYEVGAKRGFFDSRLQLNAAVFLYDYEDMQVLRSFVDSSGITLSEVVNVPEAEVYGFELEMYSLPLPHLRVFGNYSYSHAEIDSRFVALDDSFPDVNGNGIGDEPGVFPFGDQQDLDGNRLQQSPRHKYTVGAAYDVVTDFGTFTLGGRYSFVDDQEFSIFNIREARADDYHRTDLTLTYERPDGRWWVQLFVKNLEDDDTFNTRGAGGFSCQMSIPECNAAGFAISQSGVPNPPRTWGVEVQLKY